MKRHQSSHWCHGPPFFPPLDEGDRCVLFFVASSLKKDKDSVSKQVKGLEAAMECLVNQIKVRMITVKTLSGTIMETKGTIMETRSC